MGAAAIKILKLAGNAIPQLSSSWITGMTSPVVARTQLETSVSTVRTTTNGTRFFRMD